MFKKSLGVKLMFDISVENSTKASETFEAFFMNHLFKNSFLCTFNSPYVA